MPRLIILLLAVAALTILALQNLATTVPLVVLSKSLLDVPLGLLLILAVGVGALLTLLLYGLVGLGRPAASKYQPLGRRVPYPNSPSGDGSLPPSNSPSNSPSDSPLGVSSGPNTAGSYGSQSSSSQPSSSGYSSSSAFVSEPTTDASSQSKRNPADGSGSGNQPFITPPQAPPVQDTPPSNYFPPRQTASFTDSSRSNRDTRAASGSESQSAASAFAAQPIAGLKSVFSKKKIVK